MIGELDVTREAGSAESNVASVIRAQGKRTETRMTLLEVTGLRSCSHYD
jgi:hypothetical protein